MDGRDDSEGVACTVSGGVRVCAGVSTGTEIARVGVSTDPVNERVSGYLDVYRFVLPNATVVNLPCVVLLVAGTPVNPCQDAGGTFSSRTATLVDDVVAVPLPVVGGPVGAGLCNAELVLTVNGIGVPSARAFTLC